MYAGDALASSEVEVVPQRQFTLQEVELLGRAVGLQVGRACGVWLGGSSGWLAAWMGGWAAGASWLLPPGHTLCRRALLPLTAAACPLLYHSVCSGPHIRPPSRSLVAQVVEVHGDFDAAVGLDHEEAYRSVVCLRRQ